MRSVQDCERGATHERAGRLRAPERPVANGRNEQVAANSWLRHRSRSLGIPPARGERPTHVLCRAEAGIKPPPAAKSCAPSVKRRRCMHPSPARSPWSHQPGGWTAAQVRRHDGDCGVCSWRRDWLRHTVHVVRCCHDGDNIAKSNTTTTVGWQLHVHSMEGRGASKMIKNDQNKREGWNTDVDNL
jgi:hypothetical protein